jgi:hypothetical protein
MPQLTTLLRIPIGVVLNQLSRGTTLPLLFICKYNDNIKTYLKETEKEDMGWMYMAQNRVL